MEVGVARTVRWGLIPWVRPLRPRGVDIDSMCYDRSVLFSLKAITYLTREVLRPAEGAYPLRRKPGRLSAGYAEAHCTSTRNVC